VVRLVFQDVCERHPSLLSAALIATGGYGRRELSPSSDIDITVVPSDETSPELDQAIKELFNGLRGGFRRLGLEVGYAYRLVADAPGLDAKTRTGLMDMRHIAGSFELTRQLDEALQQSFSVGEFVLSKISEREEMFARFHDTPHVVEPQLKEGAGGLRCFHCSNWISESIGERASRTTAAYDKVVRFRNLLHLQTGKCQDSLTRGRQADIADLLSEDMYEMMSELSEAMAELHAFYLRSKEKIRESRFALAPGVLAVQGEARTYGAIDGGAVAVGIALATKLGLTVSNIAVPPPKSIDGPAAVYALSTGESTIRNLDRCGLLSSILPELTRCRSLMPRDTVHQYTIYEHTLRAIRYLDEIKPGSYLAEVKASVNDLEPLYLALLLHDVGKVETDKRHGQVGAEIARQVCDRWGLAENVRELVEWLVREHLVMARFIRVRDIASPQTIEEFAALVKTPQRLHLLTLLTYADIHAVSSETWTPAQETFLRELFERTIARLGLPFTDASQDVTVHRQRILRQLKKDQAEEQVQAFVNSLPAYYLTSTPAEVVRLHLEYARRAQHGEATVETYHRADLGATEVTVCTQDVPGLLSRLLGIFYALDLSVGSIRACTTASTPPIAVDVFTVSFGGRPVPTATTNQLTQTITQVVQGELSVDSLLREKGKDPSRKQNVFSYTFIEGSPGILEIRSPRGRGMPYRFSHQITSQGWNVVSARVGQWAGNATAAFYILGENGRQISKEEVHQALNEVAPALPGLD
jgi:[protein-PII] uridylyltransferase